MQTKRVTKRQTEGNTVRDTQSDVTEIRKQTDNNKGAHSLIHTHTNTHTHPHKNRQTDTQKPDSETDTRNIIVSY